MKTVTNDLINFLVIVGATFILTTYFQDRGYDSGVRKVQTEAVEHGYGEWSVMQDGHTKFFVWKIKPIPHTDLEEDENTKIVKK